MIQYALHLSSQPSLLYDGEAYGYWTGKAYTDSGEVFPVCTNKICDDTKKYKNKKVAIRALEKALKGRYSYVRSGTVVEIVTD